MCGIFAGHQGKEERMECVLMLHPVVKKEAGQRNSLVYKQ